MTDRLVPGPVISSSDRRLQDQYLAFGFVPELTDGDPLYLLGEWSRLPLRDARQVSEASLVREGVRALRAAFEESATRSEAAAGQVVLLSGGLDSRAVLGGLLELYDRAEVRTATFGMPGEQDFDFAAGVARAAGVRHEVLESFSVEWTTQGLVDSVLARELPLPHPFGQRYLSYLLHRRIGADHVFWDGLAGDVVGGKVTRQSDDRTTWEAAVADFTDANLLPDAASYTSPDFRPLSAMPAAPFVTDRVLPYPDQLMFAVRQARWTSTRAVRGHTIRMPFLSRSWLDFMLSVPVRYRQDQRLYTTILRTAHPRLFALPTTTFDGAAAPASPLVQRARLLQRRVLHEAERIGWPVRSGGKPDSGANSAIRRGHRERADIRELIASNLDDLAARGVVPGLDAAAIARAMAERRISDKRVSVLLGWELNLKALDRLAATGQRPAGP